MAPPSINRAPWRFASGEASDVIIAGGEVEFRAADLSAVYSPSAHSVSPYRNIASLHGAPDRLPVVAGSLGSLKHQVFMVGYREPIADWMVAAAALDAARAILEDRPGNIAWADFDGGFNALGPMVESNLLEHGQFRVEGDADDVVFVFTDLLGWAWYEVAQAMFAANKQQPHIFIECAVCTRWFKRVRVDQLYCSQSCNAKSHRERKQ